MREVLCASFDAFQKYLSSLCHALQIECLEQFSYVSNVVSQRWFRKVERIFNFNLDKLGTFWGVAVLS